MGADHYRSRRGGDIACDGVERMKDRFQCEVRHLLKIRAESRERVAQYLEIVEKRRGKPEADRLKVAAAEQWARGNRGKWGEWYEDDLRTHVPLAA